MPPKKKRTAAAAKAVAPAVQTPPSSPAKAASASPNRASSATPHKLSPHAAPTSPSEKDRRRSLSVAEASTPKRASQPQPLRTPERQKSHEQQQQQQQQRSRSRDIAASPSVPPAPASTPVPASDRTPRRAPSHSEPRREGSSGSGQSRTTSSAVLSLSASPVPPPPPPTTPMPVSKRPSEQQQQSKSPPAKRERTASVQETTPVKTKTAAAPASAPAALAPAPSMEKKESEEAKPKAKKPVSRNVRRQRSRHGKHNGTATLSSSSAASSPLLHAVEHLIRESKVIAPDVSGIRCLAVHPSEQQMVVARENGSLVLFDLSFFQNIPQFVQRRHTGGQTRRTITSVAYVAVPTPSSTAASFSSSSAPTAAAAAAQAASTRYVLIASMMSGQIVVYDADLLVPIALHQRSGGAIWQLTVVSHACIYAAMADGSWQQLRLVCKRAGAAPQLQLVRVVPGISGADRALTVAASLSLQMAVGSDDAGNVHAWRLPSSLESGEDEATSSGAARSRGLAEHESLWTAKLAKGIALSCAVVGGTSRPCVVVGTSMGDVVLLDAAHGHVFQTFSQHKGPVTTLAVQGDAVVYASGWHESLRTYRCSGEGDWHPAEVKRRTHYHEASQLALLPHRQLILSAARDGTVMYAPTAQLFHSPAMYVVVTTQQFAYAARRGVLLQSRFDTIEAFCMDGASRHWSPFFGHRLDGRFHLSGLWCDDQLHYILFSTEERLGLLKVVWRAQAAMSIARIEEVLELPAGTGVVDVCWSAPAVTGSAANVAAAEAEKENEEAAAAAEGATASLSSASTQRVLYILYDDKVTSVTLADGYPTVHAAVQVRGKALPDDSLRPHRVFCRPTAKATQKAESAAMELVVYGHRGSCRMQLMDDGTPDADTLVADLDDVYELVEEVPVLCKQPKEQGCDDRQASKRAKGEETVAPRTAPAVALPALVGLSVTQQRYIAGPTLHSSAAGTAPLPATLPHDVKWIARVASTAATGACKYLGYFSRGLLVASGDSWHMVRRMNVEAAFIVKEGTEVLVLERNLEKTLEALPLTWKVRRFGN